MKKDFVIRGQTANGSTETLEFGGYKEGYAYKITEFVISPSVNNADFEGCGIVTAGKTAKDPVNPNFNDEDVIATGFMGTSASQPYPVKLQFVVNDTFLITQNLLLTVADTNSTAPNPVNWQCRFESVKMTDAQAAVTNFKQFSIFDG
jgi:hypothetical protein